MEVTVAPVVERVLPLPVGVTERLAPDWSTDMAYYVRANDAGTGDETVEGPFVSESDANDHAAQWAAEFYGGEDVTWFTKDAWGTYEVGRTFADGSHADPLVTIAIEAREGDEDAE